MGLIIEKEISKPDKIKSELPISADMKRSVSAHTREIEDIISGRDDRKLMIIGPCSAWPNKAVIDYASKLSEIKNDIDDKIKLVLRSYTQKPRTTVGWTGPMNQPDPFGEEDIEAGIRYSRKMMIDALQYGIPLADEALFTHNGGYFDDLLSWVAIGARSAEDHEHRIHASGLDIPVGLKNPTSGNLGIGVNSIISAQHPHRFKYNGHQVKSTGNAYAHLILRGGDNGPNYHLEDVEKSISLMEGKVNNPAIVIDLSHGNSGKDPLRQPGVLEEILSFPQDKLVHVKGFMAESFLVDGKQDATKYNSIDELKYGKSITDGCLGIEKTYDMLKMMHSRL